MDDVAELAGLEQLPRKRDRRHKPVVEAAEVLDARPRRLLPDLVRLAGGPAGRLLADDVLARSRRGDRRLRVHRVRAAVDEQLGPLVADLLTPVGDRFGPPPELARLLERLGVPARDRDELGHERHLEVPQRLQRTRVRVAHERIAEHGHADRAPVSR